MTTQSIRNSINWSTLRPGFLLIPIAFGVAWLAFSPTARAQDLCREGCDFTLGNTFLGIEALLSNTTGSGNTASGFLALSSNTNGGANTATGNDALASNTTGSSNTATGCLALTGNTGDDNTATGAAALNNNTTGSRNVATGSAALLANQTGIDNTATGVNALYSNIGSYNTAHGYQALENNTTGTNNTANGLNALNFNTTGSSNAASGAYALYNNRGASNNSAQGYKALYSNSSGTQNTADGEVALYKNTVGNNNSALGVFALYNNTSGSGNIALGYQAGTQLTTGSNNIEIGNAGVAGESATIRIGKNGTQTNTYIAGVSGVTIAGGVGVIVDSSGHLGTNTSSARYKENIQPMDKASEAILSLKPVTFRYKHELDPENIPQFGLVAEEVEKVNPDLVARDVDGKAYTVRYEAVNAMLLNEFLKEHRIVEEQQATMAQIKSIVATQDETIGQLHEEIQALTSNLKEATQIQKVSAQLKVTRPGRTMAFNNQ